MKSSATVATLFVMIFIAAACRDDAAGSEKVSGCQSCVNDYCDCVDGDSDSQVITDCSNKAQSCITDKCSSDEATNVDYTKCGADSNSNNSSAGGSVAACQGCVDAGCSCVESAGTDQNQMLACVVTVSTCMESACIGVSEEQLDNSCLEEFETDLGR